jgi:hypothetical protein
MTYTGSLTTEQADLVDSVREAWMRTGESTERCDRPAAEAAVAAAYRAAGLAPPETVVWTDSPLAGARAVRELRQLPQDDDAIDLADLTSQVSEAFYRQQPPKEPLWGPLWRQLQGELEHQLGGPLTDPFGILDWDEGVGVELWTELRDRLKPLEEHLGGTLGSAVAGALRRQLQRPLPEEVRARLRVEVDDVWGVPPDPDAVRFWNRYGGQLDPWGDAYFLAVFGCALPIAGLAASPALDALVAAMRQVGWWWPMAEAVVLTDRPTQLRRHESGGLELLAYADGFRVPHTAISAAG